MKHLESRQIENYDYIRAAQSLQDSLFYQQQRQEQVCNVGSDGMVTIEMQQMKMTCHISDLPELLTTFTKVSM